MAFPMAFVRVFCNVRFARSPRYWRTRDNWSMQLTMQAEWDASASITGNWSVWCRYYFPPLYLPRINLTFSIREYGTWSIIGDTTGRLYDRSVERQVANAQNKSFFSIFFFLYARGLVRVTSRWSLREQTR